MTLDFSSSVLGSIFQEKYLQDLRSPAPDSPWPLCGTWFYSVQSPFFWACRKVFDMTFSSVSLVRHAWFFFVVSLRNVEILFWRNTDISVISPNPDLIWCSSYSSTSGFLLGYCQVTRCILITASWIHNILLIRAFLLSSELSDEILLDIKFKSNYKNM